MTRVRPVGPERPRPAGRRAVFFDVGNTSKPQHLARVLDQLAVDRRASHTDVVGVASWRVAGSDSARLLARRGARLLHSAPAVGVSDWTDLRIAVAAGLWLAEARPGDRIEVVSDDRAFDAVGDVEPRAPHRGLTHSHPRQPIANGVSRSAPRPEQPAVCRRVLDDATGRRGSAPAPGAPPGGGVVICSPGPSTATLLGGAGATR